jgi:outer membrane lipoprotein-sorting protein
LQLVLKWIRQRAGAQFLLFIALAPGLLSTTGCLSHTHAVEKHRRADIVLSAPLNQLLKQVDDQYGSIQSMTAHVEISSRSGGSLQGQVKESIAFNGFIIIGKPDNLNILLLVPVFGSRAMDMVSDGKNFKMLIPRYNCAIVGSNSVVNTAQKGLYSLRPNVILDSMLIRGLPDDQEVALTQDIRVIENPKKKNDIIEEPDYDLEFLSKAQGRIARAMRVIHISRANLLPYRQDIYGDEGKVVTQAFYSDYQKFGDINYPTKIVIQRPLDELGLTITVTKGTAFNQKLEGDQFKLDIPEGTHVTNMDDPASASITDPCGVHAPQSQH